MVAKFVTKVDLPINDLRNHYNNVMVRNTARLFESFKTYLESLPVRRSVVGENYVKLVTVPFFAREEDLKMMVHKLEEATGSRNARSLVRYGCGKSGCGKTSSVCPAFLYSARSKSTKSFSHYLYLAFANNGGNRFTALGLDNISSDEHVATTQGAAFMMRCLVNLLDNSQEKRIAIKRENEVQNASVESFAKTCSDLLNDRIGDGRILVHVDEHRKMANDEGDEAKRHYMYFRKGAMSMLAQVQRVVVIATFVELPHEIPADTSSETCRRAVPIPTLDIDAVMRATGVTATKVKPNQEQARMVASFKFCLAAFMSTQMSAFHQAYTLSKQDGNDLNQSDTSIREVVAMSTQYINTPNKQNLEQVSKLIKDPFSDETSQNDKHVVQMLLGMSEDDVDKSNRKIGGQIIAISARKSSVKMYYSLADLLKRIPPTDTDRDSTRKVWLLCKRLFRLKRTDRDSTRNVWLQCKSLFQEALSMNADILSGTPLERAVLWSLAITSSSLGSVKLNGSDHIFQCKSVEKARIFPNNSIVFDNSVHCNIKNLKPDTLYYADEHCGGREDGVTSHPVGDIFFLTDDKTLVLIDTTVQAYSKMNTNLKHMKTLADLWDNNEVDLPCKELLLVIFNPLESRQSGALETCSKLYCLFGVDAVNLLGGLAQCMAWY